MKYLNTFSILVYLVMEHVIFGRNWSFDQQLCREYLNYRQWKKKSTSVKSMEFSYQHSTNLIQHKSKIKVSLRNLGSFLFLWSWGSLLRKFLPIMDETRHLSSTNRSSHPEVFYEIGVLKICSKFTGEQPYRIAISIKLLCNFIEIALRHECSPVNLLHIFKTSFPRNIYGWLLLYHPLRSELILVFQ